MSLNPDAGLYKFNEYYTDNSPAHKQSINALYVSAIHLHSGN